MIIILGIVSYLADRRYKQLLDDLTNRLDEEKTYKKILEALPESLIIINDNCKDSLYCNNSFKELINNYAPTLNDLNNSISKIKKLKIRNGDNSSTQNLDNTFIRKFNITNNFSFFNKITSWLSSASKIEKASIKINKPLPASIKNKKASKNVDKKFLSKLTHENVDLKGGLTISNNNPEMLISEERQLIFKGNIDMVDVVKNSIIRSNSPKSFLNPCSSSSNIPNLDNFASEDITLDKIIEGLLMFMKDKIINKDDSIILEGYLDDKEIEIKIVSLLYHNHPSLLLLFTDMTFYNFKIKLEDNQQYKSMLLSSLSHELKTPLNGSIALIQNSVEDFSIPQRARQYLLGPALTSLNLLVSFIDNVLDYSQILTNKLKLNCKKVDIRTITHTAIDLLAFQLNKKQTIKLTVNIEESIPKEFYTDPIRYSQILIALLGNAIKFTFSGKIEVKLSYIKHQDIIKVSVKDTGLGISIRSVIQLKILFKGSNNHYIQQKLSNDSTGCALGLTIASALIKQLAPVSDEENCLDVKSIKGFGSKFTFFLGNKVGDYHNVDINRKILSNGFKKSDPLKTRSSISKRKHDNTAILGNIPSFSKINSRRIKQSKSLQKLSKHTSQSDDELFMEKSYIMSESANSDAPLSLYELRYKTDLSKSSTNIFSVLKKDKNDQEISKSKRSQENYGKILIVDDDAFNIHSLEMILHSLDMKYESVFNGESAIDMIINDANICLIFMDCNMPIMDGWEATRIIKSKIAKGEIQNIFIIASTAYCDEDNMNKCAEAGMDEILNKPLTKIKVLEILQKYHLL